MLKKSEKCVVQNVTQLLLLCHLQLYTIIQKPNVISQGHLTVGTRASEVGLILQRSMSRAFLCMHEVMHLSLQSLHKHSPAA